MSEKLIWKLPHYHLNKLNNTYNEKGIMISSMFYNYKLKIDSERKFFHQICPCVGGLFRYNPHLKGYGLKLEFSPSFPWFPIMFFLYQNYFIENWLMAMHLKTNELCVEMSRGLLTRLTDVNLPFILRVVIAMNAKRMPVVILLSAVKANYLILCRRIFAESLMTTRIYSRLKAIGIKLCI